MAETYYNIRANHQPNRLNGVEKFRVAETLQGERGGGTGICLNGVEKFRVAETVLGMEETYDDYPSQRS